MHFVLGVTSLNIGFICILDYSYSIIDAKLMKKHFY